MITTLGLHIADTNDTRFMRVADLSCYNSAKVPSCERLQVTAPGFYVPTSYPIKAGFTQVISTTNLLGASELGDLADGIYTFNYAVAPVESLWVEYLHLRTANLMKRWYSVLCALQIDCNPSKDKDSKLELLRTVDMMVKAAVGYVSYVNAPDRGFGLYQQADKKLKKLETLMGLVSTCERENQRLSI